LPTRRRLPSGNTTSIVSAADRTFTDRSGPAAAGCATSSRRCATTGSSWTRAEMVLLGYPADTPEIDVCDGLKQD
jgi:hypothetical protein